MQDITKKWPPEHIECSMVITVCGVSGRMILEVKTVIKMPRKQKYQTYKRVPGTRTIPSKPHNVGAPSSILNSGSKKNANLRQNILGFRRMVRGDAQFLAHLDLDERTRTVRINVMAMPCSTGCAQFPTDIPSRPFNSGTTPRLTCCLVPCGKIRCKRLRCGSGPGHWE